MAQSHVSYLKSKRTAVLVALGLLIVGAAALWYFYGGEGLSIKRQIREANYCETNADCKVVTGQCPFGCYIPVNVNEGDRIEVMVNAYESNCTYSCLEYKGVDCIDRKCEVRQ